jgi:glycerophosphoryl diester phosphodiesterase
MPFQPLAAETGRIHICAHRGHSIAAPENTLPALIAAARHGATCCEIDIVLTRDAEIVLLHDEIIDRTTNGRGRAADYNLAALRELDAGAWFDPSFAATRVPTLAEALAVARARGLGLLVEIKERQRAGLMLERLAETLLAERAVDNVLVISFDHPSLLRLREFLPEVRTELITRARHVDPAGMARRAGAASVAVEWNMFHPDDAKALHAAGVAVRVTLPRPEALERRRRYGIDDGPAIAAALENCLIDILAGDDAAWLAALVARHRPSI